ncbi:MAG: hypothetical protein LBM59_02220 [Ruminococcus sp.]|jgi:hypothetical protein|nr:hypothetical protein [Ruminococcus sp.]
MNESNNNQITKELLIDQLVAENYDYGDAVKIVDMICEYGEIIIEPNTLSNDFSVNSVGTTLSSVMESKIVKIVCTGSDTYKHINDIYTTIKTAINVNNMGTALYGIDATNKAGSPPSVVDLELFLNSFVSLANTLSGKATGFGIDFSLIPKALVDLYKQKSIQAAFGDIHLDLDISKPDFYENSFDFRNRLDNTIRGNYAEGLTVKDLEDLCVYFQDKYGKPLDDLLDDGVSPDKTFIQNMAAYANWRIEYELSDEIQAQEDYIDLLKTASRNKSFNDTVETIVSVLTPDEDKLQKVWENIHSWMDFGIRFTPPTFPDTGNDSANFAIYNGLIDLLRKFIKGDYTVDMGYLDWLEGIGLIELPDPYALPPFFEGNGPIDFINNSNPHPTEEDSMINELIDRYGPDTFNTIPSDETQPPEEAETVTDTDTEAPTDNETLPSDETDVGAENNTGVGEPYDPDESERIRQRYIAIAQNEIIRRAEGGLTAAQTVSSPLVIDLDGDGFETTGQAGGVYFDLDSNGFAEKTSWIGGGNDGFVTLDLNENGIIDGGAELFGNYTKLSDDTLAKDGFEALAEYDTNADGKIDSSDEVYDKLQVWVDNGNGTTENSELHSLSDLGIVSIGLEQRDDEISKLPAVHIFMPAIFIFRVGKLHIPS